MAIAIQLDDAFVIETYDGLVAYIKAHLELDSESEAQIPTFIRKGEYRLDRLCVGPYRDTSSPMTTVAGEQAISLPSDFRQLRNARFVASNGRALKEVSLQVLHDDYTQQSGQPCVFAISEGSILLGPVPDAAYGITLTYEAKIPPLSASNQTNWLLSSNADAYVYAALWQAAAWLEDLDAATAFRSEMMSIIDEVNLQGVRYRYGHQLVPRVQAVP